MGILLRFLLLIVFLLAITGMRISKADRVFTLTNNCNTTIWPAIIPGDPFAGGGFILHRSHSANFSIPDDWSGRIWARTGCTFSSSGIGPCETGACGQSVKCNTSADTPTSLAEFTLAAIDFYDVSLVDGFNLPLVVTPVDGRGPNCSACGCTGDLRDDCPDELAVKVGGRTVACRSACDVFNSDEYCCRGEYGGSEACLPTTYSKKFKDVCPTAYSYAYDDLTSLFECTGADYVVTFCGTYNPTILSP